MVSASYLVTQIQRNIRTENNCIHVMYSTKFKSRLYLTHTFSDKQRGS